MEAESDLPGGWGPEDVRRFDDHRLTRAYPPHSPASIMTTDGFKTQRAMPTGPFGLWGERPSPEARAAYDAKIAATVADDLLREEAQRQASAEAGRVVDDNPVRDGLLYRIKSPRLRAAASVVIAGVITLALLAMIPVFLAAVVFAGLRGLCEGLWWRAVDAGADVAAVLKATWSGAARVWRGD